MNPPKGWTFQKPHRDLFMRGYNAVGELLARYGWKKRLDIQSLMSAACRRDNLTDWGDDSFREPLERLVTAFDTEAHLAPLGRLILGKAIVHQLGNRLRVQRALTDGSRPVLPLQPPLFILGLPRTGTTLLLNLLAQDPRRRPLLTHEAVYPLGVRRSDGRAEARQLAWLMNRLAPGLRAVHPFEADVPEECTWLMSNTFHSPHFLMQARIPSYRDWLLAVDSSQRESAYRYLQLQLQLIQSPHADRAWLLKSPALLGWLDSLLAVFPAAKIVTIHRNYAEVIPSACSLFAVLRGIYSDDVDAARLGPDVVQLFQLLLKTSDSISQTDERIFHIQYTDLVRDPPATVRRIYEHFGDAYPQDLDERMKSWMAQQQRHKLPSHRYSLEQFGLSPSDLTDAFGTADEPAAVKTPSQTSNVAI